MGFDQWPSINDSCPVCERHSCAIYRGYYSRFLFCTELEFTGRLVHRTGYCKSLKRRFSLIPDFVIPRRRISRFTSLRLREARAGHPTVLATIDDLTCSLPEEFFLPASTAHACLRFMSFEPP